MIFDVLTLFPEMFVPVLSSIMGRATESQIIEVNLINIRDYSTNKHKKVDDYPYGGGKGMVMMIQPIYDAYNAVVRKLEYKPHVIYMSPQGSILNQSKIMKLRELKHIIVICGHYEGVDERVIENIVDEEISIGDYVLTGGELPAMVLMDCVSRTIPGVLTDEESYTDESLFKGILEYPQYTRPYDYLGMRVPEVLISGHHENINKWRKTQSLIRTYLKRRDLLEKSNLTYKEKELLFEGLKAIGQEYNL